MEFKETEIVAIPLINSQEVHPTPAVDKGPTILDSGDRTQFASGAVRDMREGKGKFDVMPLEVLARYLAEDEDDVDMVIWNLNMFLRTRETSYLYDALTYFDEKSWDNPYTLCLETAIHFEQGAKKYGPDNYRLGIPVECYIDSATRHYIKWLRGDTNEPHHRAVCWNVMCCIWEADHGDDWRANRGCTERLHNQIP